jgi:LCP family protein required for cell wall assembly
VTVISVLVVANLAAGFVLWALLTGQSFLSSAGADREVTEVLDPQMGRELTFLLVGSDSREGLSDLEYFGDFGGARADVVMLVRVDGASSRIQMLSIPRDLWVEIPGSGENRINAAYAIGGSRKLVETVKHNLQVDINHYVEIDFVGFKGLIDELGGIQLTFPYPARDTKSGLNVEAGTQIVDGSTALAYARSRSYQEYRNGRWVSVDANDLGRTERQQEVMRAMFAKLKSPSSITEAGALSRTLAKHMTIDSRLASSSVGSLAWDFRGVLTGAIEGATLPVVGRNIGGRSVVVARQPEAEAMLANFRAGRQLAERALELVGLDPRAAGLGTG